MSAFELAKIKAEHNTGQVD